MTGAERQCSRPWQSIAVGIVVGGTKFVAIGGEGQVYIPDCNRLPSS